MLSDAKAFVVCFQDDDDFHRSKIIVKTAVIDGLPPRRENRGKPIDDAFADPLARRIVEDLDVHSDSNAAGELLLDFAPDDPRLVRT
jgi:hypothetical protein